MTTPYGGGPDDVATYRGVAQPGVMYQVWSAKTAGTQHTTDLLDQFGAPLDDPYEIASDSLGNLNFSLDSVQQGDVWVVAANAPIGWPRQRIGPADLVGRFLLIESYDIPTHLPDLEGRMDSAESNIISAEAEITTLTNTVANAETFQSVKAHGAVGDGVTDDTAAIQAALNANLQGQTVYFPPGLYVVTNTLDCTGSYNLTIQGSTGIAVIGGGGASTIVFRPSSDVPAILSAGSKGLSVRNLNVTFSALSVTADITTLVSMAGNSGLEATRFSVADCTFDGGSGTYKPKQLLDIGYASCGTITRTFFNDSRETHLHGQPTAGTGWCDVINVVNCSFQTGTGSFIRNMGTDWHIDTCSFVPNSGMTGACILLAPTTGSVAASVIEGCRFGSGSSFGGSMIYGKFNNVSIRSCISAYQFAWFTAGSDGISVENCSIATQNVVGIYLDTTGGAKNWNFGENTFTGTLPVITLPAGLPWRSDSKWVNVRDFGAVGDGSTDDHTAIAAAITYLGTTGGTVYFPPGTYKMTTNSTTLAGSTNITLEGCANPASGGTPGSTILAATTGGGNLFGAASAMGLRIKNLTFSAANSSFTGSFIDLTHSSGSDTAYWTIENCFFKGGGWAVAGILTNKANDGAIRDCHFLGHATCGVLGQDSGGAGYSNGVTLDNCVFHTSTYAHLIGIGQGWVVNGCVFEDMGSLGAIYNPDAIVATQASGVQIIGCWFGDVSGTPTVYEISGSFAGLTISGCFIGYQGIDLRGASDGIEICGNEIYTNEVSGINLTTTSARHWNFFGNSFHGTDKTKYITPSGTALMRNANPVAGPSITIGNSNSGSGDGRAVIRVESDRASTQRYDLGIDPAGGSTKNWALRDASAGADILTVKPDGSLIAGIQTALATSATSGFLYVGSGAGAPSGVPTSVTGKVPVYIDSTNGTAYIYVGSWIPLATIEDVKDIENNAILNDFITCTFDASITVGTSGTMGQAVINLVKTRFRQGQVITGIGFINTATAGATLPNANVALVNVAGSVVAVGTAFTTTTANALNKQNFTSTYTIPSSGEYFMAIQTGSAATGTNPTILKSATGTVAAQINANLSAARSRFGHLTSTAGLTTSSTFTMSGMTADSQGAWLCTY